MNRVLLASLCLVILASVLRSTLAGMSMDQIRQAMKMMRNSCQNKAKASPELVDGIQQGQFPDDRNLKCYIKCAMGMMQSMKGGKLKPEAAIQQAKMMLPDEVKGRVIAALETCRNAADGITDACDVAMAGAKCIYDTDPEAFIFP
uniref:Chemosensory protein n=1 Tax=Blattella germanica TaxID=6973 RepID=A0A109QKP4_BLAGE|nr:chemosensory protein [Blattella germanica]